MITKTMQNRLETVRKQLVDLRARVVPLEKEERKILAFLEEDAAEEQELAAHDANAEEMGLGAAASDKLKRGAA